MFQIFSLSQKHIDNESGSYFIWSDSTRNFITHLSFPLMLIHREKRCGCWIIENPSADTRCEMRWVTFAQAVLSPFPIFFTYVTCKHKQMHVFFNVLMQRYTCVIHSVPHALLSLPIHPSFCLYVCMSNSVCLPISPSLSYSIAVWQT